MTDNHEDGRIDWKTQIVHVYLHVGSFVYHMKCMSCMTGIPEWLSLPCTSTTTHAMDDILPSDVEALETEWLLVSQTLEWSGQQILFVKDINFIDAYSCNNNICTVINKQCVKVVTDNLWPKLAHILYGWLRVRVTLSRMSQIQKRVWCQLQVQDFIWLRAVIPRYCNISFCCYESTNVPVINMYTCICSSITEWLSLSDASPHSLYPLTLTELSLSLNTEEGQWNQIEHL
jgi:hypothetical protein